MVRGADEHSAGASDLVGTILGDYEITELIRGTKKSWVFRARDGRFERDVALKVLKPESGRERQAQFSREGPRLAALEEHPNITTVYAGGEEKGFHYMAMKLVEGRDLQKVIDSGERFSLSRILDILSSVAGAVCYAHEKGVEHNDIKLKNITEGDAAGGRAYLLDFGSTLTRDASSDDVFSIGVVARELLQRRENPQRKVPEKLEQIVKTATVLGGFTTPEQFKRAIESYRKGLILRRRFLISSAVVTGTAAVVSPIAYVVHRHRERERYLRSIDCAVDEVAKTEVGDSEGLDSLFREVKKRVCSQKVSVWEEEVPRGKTPYATTDGGTWHNIRSPHWTSGFLAGSFWESFSETGDAKFREWASQRTAEIKITDADALSNTAVRFFYSHAKGYEATKDEVHKQTALEALELLARRFNNTRRLVLLNMNQPNYSEAGTMMDIVPFLLWGFGVTNDDGYLQMASRHVDTVLNLHVRRDGSVRKTAIFNPMTHEVLEERNSKGISSNSTLARSQAQILPGAIEFLAVNQNPHVLERIQKVADYFIEQCALSPDSIPYFDFQAPRNPTIPRDTSAVTVALPWLSKLSELTENESYEKAGRIMKKSLVVSYLSTDLEGYSGVIREGCANWRNQEYVRSSLIWGDYHFLIS